VNTTDSRVELRWDVRASTAIDETQRARLLERLAPRLTATGVLVLFGDEHRSQQRNRAAVRERLRELVAEALVPPRARRATRPTRGAVERRLEEKRQRASRKGSRRRPEGGGDD
jgi:ribosome-associated protein